MPKELVVLRTCGDRAAAVITYRDGQTSTVAPRQAGAARELARIADEHGDACVAWYDERLHPFLAPPSSWTGLMRHNLEVLHASAHQNCQAMMSSLGFVDFDSPFLLSPPTDRRYPTWLVASMAGICRSPVIRAVGLDASYGSLAACLVDFGFRAARAGACIYSEPALLCKPLPDALPADLQRPLPDRIQAKLVSRLYGKKWLLFWMLAAGLFEHRLCLRCVSGLSGGRAGRKTDTDMLRRLAPKDAGLVAPTTIDAIIPTLGRPEATVDVLNDLAAQTLRPSTVIVIEQSPDGVPAGPLQEAVRATWPFRLEHRLLTSIGACRARNVGLAMATADWVLFLDDDVRFPPETIERFVGVACAYRVGGVVASVRRPGQPAMAVNEPPFMWPGFASGAGLVAREAAQATQGFDERLEGGFGEDYEFGIQLRMAGANILYAPGVPVLHLKAPIGGFRHVYPHPWLKDAVQPRPSPTVLYSRYKHVTSRMQDGCMLFYWLKRLASVGPYRWLPEFLALRRQWRAAECWCQRLATLQPGGIPLPR